MNTEIPITPQQQAQNETIANFMKEGIWRACNKGGRHKVFWANEYKTKEECQSDIDTYANETRGEVEPRLFPPDYHKSWDALMPAYKKFTKLNGLSIHPFNLHCKMISDWIVRVDVGSAYGALFAAIQWYNEQ